MLTVFDMDGVLIEERSSWRIINHKFNIDNSELVKKYRKGEINDRQFIDGDIKKWRENGIKRRDIMKVLKEVILTPGIKECMKFFGKKGDVAIISGGIDILAKRIARFGVKYVFANGIEFRKEIPWKGIYRVPIKKKEEVLKDLMQILDLKREDVVVVGDTKYDGEMMRMAGAGIAFNPDGEIERYADYVVKKRDLRELIKIFE